MKLSIIVPVYNAENYLEKCVDSIFAQTMEDFELILVNDGSKDGSQRIIDRYCEAEPERVIALVLENGGQGRARNHGIEIARGEYLGFVDSDDWIAPDMYEKMCGAADRENADIAVCDMKTECIDGSSEYIISWENDNPFRAACSCCNKIFRRSLVEDIRYPEGLWYEDFDFSAKMLIKSSANTHIPEALYVYRVGQQSTMTNDNSEKNLDIITVMEDIRLFMEAEGKTESFEYLLINHVLFEAVNRVAAHNSSNKKQVVERMLDYVHRNIPYINTCSAFKNEGIKRRIIMFLNYHSLEQLSRFILKVKNCIK